MIFPLPSLQSSGPLLQPASSLSVPRKARNPRWILGVALILWTLWGELTLWAALAALQRAPEQEEAGARIEACGLFLEGHDPVRAAEEWARLPRWVFSTEDGAAMLEKLKPLYDEVLGKFSGAWRRLAKSPGAVPEPGEISAWISRLSRHRERGSRLQERAG